MTRPDEQLLELLRRRRSRRNFDGRPVSEEIVERLVEAACWAPSACDRQAWRFVVIADERLKAALVDAGAATMVRDAPCSILVCYGRATRNAAYRDDVQSAAAATQNLLLAAEAWNLAACWVCTLPAPEDLRRLLAIPETYSPHGLVCLGHPSDPVPRPVARRRPPRERFAYDRFPEGADDELPSLARARLESWAITLYHRSPSPLKRVVWNPLIRRFLTRRFEN